jgi:hypothetical protein
MSFISFPCLIALSRISKAKLNRNDESYHLCLVSDLTGKDFQPFSVECDSGGWLVAYGLY